MDRVWEKNYALRAIDFDKFNRIKPSAVLELFQDAAGQHAESVGVGFAALLKRSYLWVLTQIKFRIIREPESYQEVIVRTWPLAPNRLGYRREYAIENKNGERLIVGSSKWVIMHSEKRSLITGTNVYPFDDGFCTEMMFEERIGKIRNFETDAAPRTVIAGFSELDANNHVNNTKYANYVMDAIDPSADDAVDTFQIDYRKEVMEGEKLDVFHTREGGTALAKGINEAGDTVFACRIEFK